MTNDRIIRYSIRKYASVIIHRLRHEKLIDNIRTIYFNVMA